MIPAQQKDEQLLADIAAARPENAPLGFDCWWLGQSGFLLKTVGGSILLDPYLSDSLTKKYSQTDKPHVRMSERCVDPSRLTGINIVSSSHNHTDHLDKETLGPLLTNQPNCELVIPEANREFVSQRLELPIESPLGLTEQQSISIGAFTWHGIAAAHNRVDRDDQGRCRYLGYVVQFDSPVGPKCIYHSGDTLWHDDLVNQLSEFPIDLALLPINGNLPTRRVSGNLWGQEAAALAKEICASLVVPCHYDLFTFNTVTPDAFVAACQELDQPFEVLKIGQRLTPSRI